MLTLNRPICLSIGRNNNIIRFIENNQAQVGNQNVNDIDVNNINDLKHLVVGLDIFGQGIAFRFVILDEIEIHFQDIVNNIINDASYDKKLRIVSDYYWSSEAKRLRGRCLEVWMLIYNYYNILSELVLQYEFLDEIELKLSKPYLPSKEEFQLRELQQKITNYIKALKARIQQLENQILNAWNNRPECFV